MKVALLALYPRQEEDEDDENSPWREQFRTEAQAAQPAPLMGEDSESPQNVDSQNFPRGVVEEVALLALYPRQDEDEDEDSPRRDETAAVGLYPWQDEDEDEDSPWREED